MTAFSIFDVYSQNFPHGESIPENILASSKSVASWSLEA